jgi:hypothetical protein
MESISSADIMTLQSILKIGCANTSQRYLKFWHYLLVIPAEAGIQDFLCAIFSGFLPSQE